MEQLEQNQSIIIYQPALVGLDLGQKDCQITRNEQQFEKNASNKERFRKLSQHSLVQQIKMLAKRVDSGLSSKANTMSQSKLSSDKSFRSVKQKILLSYNKQQEKLKSKNAQLLEPWQLQDLGYFTFQIVKQKRNKHHIDTFLKQKKEKQELLQTFARR